MALLPQLYDLIKKRHIRAYLVGGSVRDALLGRPRYDIDLSVAGDAIDLAREFADQLGGTFYVMEEEFDVARAIIQRADARYLVDFARVRGDDIEQDLATRDFTMNAMAADISHGEWTERDLIDPFNGRDDLDARRIRVVSSSVFDDDPVRLLRAVRFEASLGFALEANTEMLVRREARKLVDSSSERVRDEFYRIISAENCARHIRRLDDLDLLNYLLPEVTGLKGVKQTDPHHYDVFDHALHTLEALENMQRSGFLDLAEGAFADRLSLHFANPVSDGRNRGHLLRVATLLHDIGKPLTQTHAAGGEIQFVEHEQLGVELAARALRRLRFSNDEISLLTTIIGEHMRPLDLARERQLTDQGVYRYFRATGDAGVDIAIHAWCDMRARSEKAQPFEIDSALQVVIARLLDRFFHARDRVIDPPMLLNGHELISLLEIPEGPLVGNYLEALREAEATGQVTTREQAVDFVRNWQPNGPAN